MKAVETMIAADLLAEFANLRPEDVAAFRLKILGSDFIPDAWWDYRGGKQWSLNQQWLREAWDKFENMDLFSKLRLITSVFEPADTLDSLLGIKREPNKQSACADPIEMSKEYGYHRALQYLMEHSWAAKKCGECGGYFVASHNARKYCSVARKDGDGEKCSKKGLNRSKRNYWEANKARIRPRQEKGGM
jgi:hypothetical protein